MAGIKESKELLKAVTTIASFLIFRLKDGIGADDAVAFFTKITTDAEFKKVFTDAVEGIGEVPAEFKDLEIEEIFELIAYLLPEIMKVIVSLKK